MSFSSSDLGGPVINPEFDVPFTFDFNTGSVNEVEQGSDYDIANQIWALLTYEPGQLIAQPTLGIPDQSFSLNGANLDMIQRVIQKWIPGANELITRDPNWFQTLIDQIYIQNDPTGSQTSQEDTGTNA